ncbi:DUF1989 domain-containing protein [Tsukamurella ocularis]|uniref:DUF1989 domain-containing protein n=1 Tax=Tsukamurella ocularis TaxID=1970234 RepID=UPI0039EE073C
MITTLPPRAPWSGIVPAGHTLTMTDLHGKPSIDTLFYGAHDHGIRYSTQQTITGQRNIYLGEGTVIRDQESRPMVTIVHDEVGRHDTLSSACSQESNSLRYGHHTKHEHACVENFLIEGSRHGLGMRDLVGNVNFYVFAPVAPDGTFGAVEGESTVGRKVVLRAEIDILVLISNCPQVNDPCHDFGLAAVELEVSDSVA